MRDFSKFTCFVKGVIETGTAIKYGDKQLTRELKMHFNRLLNDSLQFEKYLHSMLGEEMAQHEEDINHQIIDLVWKIFDLPEGQLDKFIDHINAFEES